MGGEGGEGESSERSVTRDTHRRLIMTGRMMCKKDQGGYLKACLARARVAVERVRNGERA